MPTDGTILSGLLTTERFTDERYMNPRREVFRQFPNGGLALTGLLSMLDSQVTNDPSFKIFEKRYVSYETATAQANAAGPFTNTSDVDKTEAGFSEVATATVRIYLVSADLITVDTILKIWGVNTTGTKVDLIGRVTAVDTTNDHVDVKISNSGSAWTNILNSTANNGLIVQAVGTAVKEGSDTNNYNPFITPVEVSNHCQIQRTSFRIPKTTLVTDIEYDKSGPYKELYYDSSLKMMQFIEDMFLWGDYGKESSVEGEVIRYTGGLLWYLKQWELGTVYKNSSTAITSYDDDQKRIIDLSAWKSGVLTEATMDLLMERIFRTDMSKTNEKFVCCGSGFLMTLNQLYKSKSVIIQDTPTKDTYGMKIVTLITPFGTVHFYSHPRFSHSPRLRHAAFFIDFSNLTYMHPKERDLMFQPDVQPAKADYKEDQFLVECGLLQKFPETGMLITNALTYGP